MRALCARPRARGAGRAGVVPDCRTARQPDSTDYARTSDVSRVNAQVSTLVSQRRPPDHAGKPVRLNAGTDEP